MIKKDKLLNSILPLISVVAILILWIVASKSVDNEFILPNLLATVKSFFLLFASKEFYLAVLGTFLRSLIGFIFSFIIAFALAVLSAKLKYAERLISPIISILRALPTIAVVLLLLLWTNSTVAPVLVTALVVLPTVYTGVYSALIGIDKTVTDAGRVDGCGERQVFMLVELPLVKPTVYRVIGSGFSLNFKLMVAAEVIAQTANSLGYMSATMVRSITAGRM